MMGVQRGAVVTAVPQTELDYPARLQVQWQIQMWI